MITDNEDAIEKYNSFIASQNLGFYGQAEVRIGQAFAYEDLSDVRNGRVIYPDQYIKIATGLRIAIGSAVFDLDKSSQIVKAY